MQPPICPLACSAPPPHRRTPAADRVHGSAACQQPVAAAALRRSETQAPAADDRCRSHAGCLACMQSANAAVLFQLPPAPALARQLPPSSAAAQHVAMRIVYPDRLSELIVSLRGCPCLAAASHAETWRPFNRSRPATPCWIGRRCKVASLRLQALGRFSHTIDASNDEVLDYQHLQTAV